MSLRQRTVADWEAFLLRAPLLIFLLSASICLGQSDGTARTVFSKSKDSVFLVYLNDSSGKPTALGSAFLIRPHLLVTNSHVVSAGSPVLAVGPLRVQLKVLRVDRKNDLALLSVDAELTSTPLQLSQEKPQPGQEVFAIGNPEGLENSISQGIIAGLRNVEDRELIQITSPISHGSSGGPILDSHGEVIGVAVGMLQDGQNLNFAVPAKYVKALLDAPQSSTVESADCSNRGTELSALIEKKKGDTYSDEPSSEYQVDSNKLRELATSSVQLCKQPRLLQTIACLEVNDASLVDSSISAVKELTSVAPSVDSRALLAYILFDSSRSETLIAALAPDEGPDKQNAVKASSALSSEAEQEANAILRQAKGKSLDVANYVLAGVKQDRNDFAGAMPLHDEVARAAPQICGQDLALSAYRSLVSESDQSGNTQASENWFKRYSAIYSPESYEWDEEGDRRWKAKDFATAAIAYEKAGTNATYDYDYCYAAIAQYLREPSDVDGVLSDGRRCVDVSTTDTRSSAKTYFQSELPIVYRSMAEVLDDRGVYDQALAYIKRVWP